MSKPGKYKFAGSKRPCVQVDEHFPSAQIAALRISNRITECDLGDTNIPARLAPSFSTAPVALKNAPGGP
jgi:hypothetical protein